MTEWVALTALCLSWVVFFIGVVSYWRAGAARWKVAVFKKAALEQKRLCEKAVNKLVLAEAEDDDDVAGQLEGWL